uniref:Uncharacterized protein n=1 Tax=Candidatus Methanogaster sp. ANME-2c ERB4 TaxID=2759911 RepID=A0A7G9YAW0_9EURY|nr:hypothetical protein NBMHDOOP_00011 [Methanosarcinales archaeon ANME-2c ERB4]
MGYFEPDGERMRKVLCLRNDVRNVSYNSSSASGAVQRNNASPPPDQKTILLARHIEPISSEAETGCIQNLFLKQSPHP